MELAKAKTEFLKLLDGTAPGAVGEFLRWVTDSFSVEAAREEVDADAEAKATLIAIAQEVRGRLPANAMVESERIHWPRESGDFPPGKTVHVDSFLYSDDEVDVLAEQGLLSRAVCKACGSMDTEPTTFISHSLSQRALRFLFTSIFSQGDLGGKMVVDVGSRLGVVLYAGFLYAPTAHFVGLELNAELAKLSMEMLAKWGMSERCRVLPQDLRASQDIIAAADLIVLNNVFQFFLPAQEQSECWRALKAFLRSGTLVLSNPSIPEAIKDLPDLGDFSVQAWAEEIPILSQAAKFAGTDEDLYEELSNLHLYRIR